MPTPSAQGLNPAFHCTFCDQVFGRKEHLTRHRRIHTQEKPFRCPSCTKCFSRLDVLNRHISTHEQQEVAPIALATSRACNQCAVDRLRCSRGNPCRRCSHRHLLCSYPQPRRTRSQMQPTSTPASMMAGPENLGSIDTIQNETFNLHYDPMAWTLGADHMQFPSNPDQFGMGISGTNWLSPQFDDGTDLDALFAGLANGLNVQGLTNGTIDSPSILEDSVSSGTLLQGFTQTDKEMDSSEYYVSGDGARAPFKGRPHRRGSALSNGPSHESGSDESVPSPLLPKEATCSLCPLETYENLCRAVAAETRAQGDDRTEFRIPTHKQVQFYVERYFQLFHPIFPFLRRVSFANDSSEEWLLLLAVSVVGSKFTSRLNHHTEEDSLFQLLRRALRRQWSKSLAERRNMNRQELYIPGETTRYKSPPSLMVLQAGVLNVFCMLHSGKRDLVEQALDERYRLVESCFLLGLLCEQNEKIDMNVGMHHPEESIKKWILCEARIRTGMTIWLLDSMFIYTLQEKPLMRLEDVKTVLPSHEESFENADVLRTGKRLPCSLTLQEALEMMYIEKTLPTDLGEFSHVLLVNAIYRHTKDVLEREQSCLNTWTPTARKQQRPDTRPSQVSYLPITPTASQWRNSACDCLDILHWLANSKVARPAGFEHHTILHLHLARIKILTPIKFIQSYATQNVTTHDAPESQEDQELYTARFQLLHWIIRDQCKARLSIIHCSALYWHVRRYSCDSILEPYAIYIATLVLWAYSSCLNLPEVVATTMAGFGQDVEPSFLHLDRPIDDELVQAFVREGNKMAAHISKVGDIRSGSAPAKILKEGIVLLAGSSHLSSDELQDPEETGYTWGIERSYVRFLRDLLHATTEISQRC